MRGAWILSAQRLARSCPTGGRDTFRATFSDVGDLKAHLPGCSDEPTVVTGDRDRIALSAHKIRRGEMQRIEGSHLDREWAAGPVEDWHYHLEEVDSLQEQIHQLRVRRCKAAGVDSCPD